MVIRSHNGGNKVLTIDRIKKINNKPALSEFLRLMNWTRDDFEKMKWADITSRYPLGYYKNNKN